MGEIQILPELLINKIAAGEVVERPASVVKELVENSIDAGADQIFVTIKNGGKDLISVMDNGKGMSSADTNLAIERHATSKIQVVEDLESIHTMGFRGEALAAISSVSRFEISTCADEIEGGSRLLSEGGKIQQTGKIGFPQGTKIVVENLFFNTPARQKFMKAVNTEYSHIYDIVLRLAMGNPAIQFRLTHNQAITLNLPKSQSFADRIRDCFGAEIADSLTEIEHEESYLKFSGLFSLPAESRPSKRWQHLFVNERYVKSQSINHGIYQGYKTLLMKHMHPLFFVKVQLDPKEIDVNVHPAKTEIRFKNQNLIHTIVADQIGRKIKTATRKQFFQKDEIPAPQSLENSSTEQPPKQDPRPEPPFNPSFSVGRNDQLGFHSQESEKRCSPFPSGSSSRPTSQKPQVSKEQHREDQAFVFEKRYFSEEGKKEEDSIQEGSENKIAVLESSPYQLIGQYNKYILAHGGDQLVLVDKHAAHERIRFEEIRKQFYARSMPTESLLVPLMIELPPQDGILLEQYQESWEKLGFRIEPFGGNDYSLKEVPSILKDKDIVAVIRSVLDELAQFGKSGKLEEFFNEVFESMACHSAIRGDQELSTEEMTGLLNQLANLDLHIHCPHGRPVIIEVAEYELERRFKRIV